MKYLKTTQLLTVIGIFLISSCAKDEEQLGNSDPVIDPPAITHYTVQFGEGSNWTVGSPIFQQNLTEHVTYQTNLFLEGTMKMAGFLLEDDEARYFHKVTSKADIDQIVAQDPALIDQTLSVIEKEAVAILIEQVLTEDEIDGKSYFIVEYTPGSDWVDSKKLWEQDLTEHIAYITTKFGEKFVLRGLQYLNVDRAMYIVLADDLDAVENFVSDDPAVNNGIFSETILPYAVNVEQL
ncbi:MAG TPA: hypothetical protein DDX92_13620 [Flavobacteriales bacterium]|jgi:uncharacterized protein YciI|nr:hypothetical protein [Flavobacteriales bacterium]